MNRQIRPFSNDDSESVIQLSLLARIIHGA